ncbi:hypothetical protein [Actinoplanes sp. L3-i22]|uniref:hypothetical protein n=1 Tax=Actinoplanes sp. L3-i22 TaxID=2836373 RepID=UPI001C773519|nr:hypothetical protein [Actinoplanes sp. L3-i22]BCY05396.1 hypothetical protein L3i22_004840 [Actinoplanes sp. L3-i22]
MSDSYTGPAEISSDELGSFRAAVELWTTEDGGWVGTCLLEDERLEDKTVTIRIDNGKSGTARVNGEVLTGSGPAPFR